MKITPILFVDEIEPSLEFWAGRLGFEKTVEVPEGDKLGFVILQKGDAELMMQTRASVEKDVPALADLTRRGTQVGVYIEVPDFEDLLKRLGGAQVVMPERKTFYGMREIAVREPGGNVVCFAARSET